MLIHWAWRDQGLIVPARNPKKLRAISDLARPGVAVACRQDGAGSRLLLTHLLEQAGIAERRIKLADPVLRSESDVAAAVLDGRADCGLGIAAAARRHRLGFVPLHRERFDAAISSMSACRGCCGSRAARLSRNTPPRSAATMPPRQGGCSFLEPLASPSKGIERSGQKQGEFQRGDAASQVKREASALWARAAEFGQQAAGLDLGLVVVDHGSPAKRRMVPFPRGGTDAGGGR